MLRTIDLYATWFLFHPDVLEWTCRHTKLEVGVLVCVWGSVLSYVCDINFVDMLGECIFLLFRKDEQLSPMEHPWMQIWSLALIQRFSVSISFISISYVPLSRVRKIYAYIQTSNTVLLFRKYLVTFESKEFDGQFGSPFSKKEKKSNAGIRWLSFSKISNFNTHFFLYTFPWKS